MYWKIIQRILNSGSRKHSGLVKGSVSVFFNKAESKSERQERMTFSYVLFRYGLFQGCWVNLWWSLWRSYEQRCQEVMPSQMLSYVFQDSRMFSGGSRFNPLKIHQGKLLQGPWQAQVLPVRNQWAHVLPMASWKAQVSTSSGYPVGTGTPFLILAGVVDWKSNVSEWHALSDVVLFLSGILEGTWQAEALSVGTQWEWVFPHRTWYLVITGSSFWDPVGLVVPQGTW